MSRRVVVTGMGVVAPNGVGIPAFLHAFRMAFPESGSYHYMSICIFTHRFVAYLNLNSAT